MSETTHGFVRRALLLAFLSGLSIGAAEAVVPKKGDDVLERKQLFRPDLLLAMRNVPLGEVMDRLPNRAAWEAFTRARAAAGEPFHVFIDPASGTATSITRAVPLIPGSGAGNGVTLPALGRRLGRSLKAVDAEAVADATLAFVRQQQDLLGIDTAQLGAVRAAPITPDLWQVDIRQQYRGIPVRDGHLAATIGHGNLVVVGAVAWGNVTLPDVTPTLAAETAVAHGFAYAEGRTADDEVGPPVLEIVGSGQTALAEEGRQAVAGGYAYRLVWTFTFRRPPAVGRWEVMVDAHSGEVVSFQDLNRYAKRQVTGGVYPLASTDVCPGATTCGAMQSAWPMPFANTGYPAPGNFSNSAGVFDFTSGNGFTTLAGRYFTVQGHAPLSENSLGGSIPLGGTNGQHDLTSAGSSAGDTAAARTAFYELNKIAEMARGYLPDNELLRGDPLATVVNENDTCNAYYDPGPNPFPPFPGGPPSIHFFRSGPYGSAVCRNTGEIASVMDHEWGHWLDDNDTNRSGSAEEYGDIAALYRTQTSCLGPGFFQASNDGCGQSPDGTGANVDMDGVSGVRHCATSCSGVREADWAKHIPATPDTAAGFACSSCIKFENGYWSISPHCLAAPSDQAAWDLVKRDLPAAPFGLDSQSAFMTGNKLFYQGSGLIHGWYTFGNGVCGSTPSNGCGVSNGYMQWIAADDDNGTLNDGTPHMTALFNAFNRHGIACAAPAAVNSGCAGGPTAAPSLTVTPGHYQASLSWTAVPGATRYWVFRSEGHAGCNYGKALIAEVAGTSYVDTEVAAGRPYHYNVVAAGTQSACYGRMSNCATVTPAAGSYTVSCAPSSLYLGTGGGSVNTLCTAQSTGGYTSPVSLACVGLPAGVSCSVSPSTGTLTANGSVSFMVRVTAQPLSPGTRSFQVRGAPSATPSGIHSAPLTLTVNSTTGGLTAIFDAIRQAPRCSFTHSCDTGTLVNGSAGSEPNQPNTINDSCAEGPTAGFIDKVRVYSPVGLKFAAGAGVVVEAIVNTGFVFEDAVDFFYASDADNPSWVFIGTVVPSSHELQYLSLPYTLPAGPLQAVRVQYRSGFESSLQEVECTANSGDERDDLIFAVLP